MIAARRRRGKSGLRRARWWVTPTRGDPRDSATENRPPAQAGKGETVVQETTSIPGDRDGSANPTWSKTKKDAARRSRTWMRAARPSVRVGRTASGQEAVGNGGHRWMITARARGHRIRLTGRLVPLVAPLVVPPHEVHERLSKTESRHGGRLCHPTGSPPAPRRATVRLPRSHRTQLGADPGRAGPASPGGARESRRRQAGPPGRTAIRRCRSAHPCPGSQAVGRAWSCPTPAGHRTP